MEKKIVVNAAGEKLLLGNNIINLSDQTKGTFKTNSLMALAEYLTVLDFEIFANGLNIDAYLSKDILFDALNYTTMPHAQCVLKYSQQIELLKRINQKPHSLPEFIELMRTLKKYSDKDALQLLDALNDLKIKKIIDIQHKTDSRGNFNVVIKADKGSSDYQFPETISFVVPLFDVRDGLEVQVDFDLTFTWSFEESAAKLSFKLTNYDLNADLELAVWLKCTEVLKGDNIVLNHGSYSINQQTNEYLFKESSIE